METYKDNPEFTRRRPNVNLPLPQYKSTKKAQLKSRNQHARLMLLFHGVAKRRTFLDTQKAKRYENSLTQPSDLRLNTRILSHGLLSKFLIKASGTFQISLCKMGVHWASAFVYSDIWTSKIKENIPGV